MTGPRETAGPSLIVTARKKKKYVVPPKACSELVFVPGGISTVNLLPVYELLYSSLYFNKIPLTSSGLFQDNRKTGPVEAIGGVIVSMRCCGAVGAEN